MRSRSSRLALLAVLLVAAAGCQSQETPPPETGAPPATEAPYPPAAETPPPTELEADTTAATPETGGGE